jgi:hypothetical protein
MIFGVLPPLAIRVWRGTIPTVNFWKEHLNPRFSPFEIERKFVLPHKHRSHK